MSLFDKAKDKVEQLIGDAEEKVGEMLGHDDSENPGNHRQSSEAKEAVGPELNDEAAEGKASDDNK